jgi:D-3-phosphoglycerate dehydrogenase
MSVYRENLPIKTVNLLVVAAIKGLLSQALRERVNYVNAAIEAKERGIRVIQTRDASTLRLFGFDSFGS